MNRPSRRRAFSLFELVVVMLLLGVLAGVAASLAGDSYNDSLVAATAQHLKTIALAVEIYHNEQGDWPADGDAGVLPDEMDGRLRPNLFAVECPLGGAYDWDKGVDGRVAQLKVTGDSYDADAWRQVDQQIDDGDLTAGNLRLLTSPPGPRVVWVLED